MNKNLTVSGSPEKWFNLSKLAFDRMKLTNLETDDIFYFISGIHPKYGKLSVEVKMKNSDKVALEMNFENEELFIGFKRAIKMALSSSQTLDTEEESTISAKNEKAKTPQKTKKIGKKAVVMLLAFVFVVLVAVGAYDITYRNLYGKSVFEKKSEYYLNETAKVGGLSVEFSDYEEVVFPNDPDQLIQFTPPDGYVYLGATYNITNNTDKTITLSSFQFSGYSDNQSVSQDLGLAMFSNGGTVDGDIAPGKTKTSTLVFDFPTAWSSGQIDFKYDVNKEPVKFIFNK